MKRSRRTGGYGDLLWKLNLVEIDELLERHRNDLDQHQIKGFRNLVSGLDDFFEESNMSIGDDHQIETFASVALESSDIVRAIKNFHGKPMFSNITISAKDEEGYGVTWYGLVSIIFQRILTLFNTYIRFLTHFITYQGIANTQVLHGFWKRAT